MCKLINGSANVGLRIPCPGELGPSDGDPCQCLLDEVVCFGAAAGECEPETEQVRYAGAAYAEKSAARSIRIRRLLPIASQHGAAV